MSNYTFPEPGQLGMLSAPTSSRLRRLLGSTNVGLINNVSAWAPLRVIGCRRIKHETIAMRTISVVLTMMYPTQ